MKQIYYIHVKIKTPAIIKVLATSEYEAISRLHIGAWHGVEANPKDWSKAEVTHTGPIEKVSEVTDSE